MANANAVPRTHHPQLDGVRGLSMICVLVGHIGQFSLGIEKSGQIAELGVMVFFVLSGFLITDILSHERARTGSISFKRFYARRALRLFPALYFFLAVLIALKLANQVDDVPWLTIVSALLYLSNIFGRGQSIGHLWSLAMEEQFYAIWPAFMLLIKPSRLLSLAIGFVAFMILWRCLAIHFALFDFNRGIFYLRPYFRFDSILVGCVLALLLNNSPRISTWLRGNIRFFHPAWVVPTLLAWSVLGTGVALRPIFISVQMLLAWVLVAHVLLRTGTLTSRVLSTAALRFAGKVSYSVYLWQQIFLVTKVPSWGWLREFPVDLILAVLAGLASHYVIEQPFQRLKERKFTSAVDTAPAL